MKPTPFQDAPRSPLVRPPVPLKRWVLGIVLLALGAALGVGCFLAARSGPARLAFRLGEFALLLFINGAGITGYAVATRRASKRFEAGLCPRCGFNLGGRFDAPCPRCFPDGDPNFISPAASKEEFQAWLQRQPREQRRLFSESSVEARFRDLTLQPSFKFRLSPILHDEAITFLDTTHTSLAIRIAALGLLGAFGAAGVALIFVGHADVGIVFVVASLAMTAGFAWKLRTERAKVRTVTFWPSAASVVDQLVLRGRSRQVAGSLADVYITVSGLRGIYGQKHEVVAVVLWAPSGPMLLACDGEESRLEPYLASLPDWLRATERADPAHIDIKRRPRPTDRATA